MAPTTTERKPCRFRLLSCGCNSSSVWPLGCITSHKNSGAESPAATLDTLDMTCTRRLPPTSSLEVLDSPDAWFCQGPISACNHPNHHNSIFINRNHRNHHSTSHVQQLRQRISWLHIERACQQFMWQARAHHPNNSQPLSTPTTNRSTIITPPAHRPCRSLPRTVPPPDCSLEGGEGAWGGLYGDLHVGDLTHSLLQYMAFQIDKHLLGESFHCAMQLPRHRCNNTITSNTPTTPTSNRNHNSNHLVQGSTTTTARSVPGIEYRVLDYVPAHINTWFSPTTPTTPTTSDPDLSPSLHSPPSHHPHQHQQQHTRRRRKASSTTHNPGASQRSYQQPPVPIAEQGLAGYSPTAHCIFFSRNIFTAMTAPIPPPMPPPIPPPMLPQFTTSPMTPPMSSPPMTSPMTPLMHARMDITSAPQPTDLHNLIRTRSRPVTTLRLAPTTLSQLTRHQECMEAPVHHTGQAAYFAACTSSSSSSSSAAAAAQGKPSPCVKPSSPRANHPSSCRGQPSRGPARHLWACPSLGRPVYVDGWLCSSRMMFVLHVLAHEMVHAVSEVMCPQASCLPSNHRNQGHGQLFTKLSHALMGHAPPQGAWGFRRSMFGSMASARRHNTKCDEQ